MKKNVLTSSEIKEFILKHLGFTHVDDVDDLRSDLRLGEARINELVKACNAEFKASVTKEHLHKVKQLVKRVKETAEINNTSAE